MRKILTACHSRISKKTKENRKYELNYEGVLPFSVYLVFALSIAISINRKTGDKRYEDK